MDHFGIGAALLGAANIYFNSARQTGRTTSLIESVKDGDRIIVSHGDPVVRSAVRLFGGDGGSSQGHALALWCGQKDCKRC